MFQQLIESFTQTAGKQITGTCLALSYLSGLAEKGLYDFSKENISKTLIDLHPNHLGSNGFIEDTIEFFKALGFRVQLFRDLQLVDLAKFTKNGRMLNDHFVIVDFSQPEHHVHCNSLRFRVDQTASLKQLYQFSGKDYYGFRTDAPTSCRVIKIME